MIKIEKVIYFDGLEYKPYEQPAGCLDVIDACNELKNLITYDEYKYLDDLIVEVADGRVDVYTADLVANCSNTAFIPYIDETIVEFGIFDSITQLYSTAEYCYYYNQLNSNLKAIVQNAVIDDLRKKSITVNANNSEIDELIDSIQSFVFNYVENVKSEGYIISDFRSELQGYLDELNAEDKLIKVSTSDDDEPDSMYAHPDDAVTNEPISLGTRYIDDEYNETLFADFDIDEYDCVPSQLEL